MADGETPESALGPRLVGLWGAPFTGPQSVIAVHAAVLHTGKVLLFFGNPKAALWEPSTGNVQEVSAPADVFCAGQAFLPDGRLLLAGGAIPNQTQCGPPFTHTFDPVSETWTRHADMRQGRYYPTTTLLSDGTMLITNGNTEAGRHALNTDLEVFDPATNSLTVVGTQAIGLYAHQSVLPDGTVLVAGPSKDTFRIDPSDWSTVALPSMRNRHTHGGGFLVPGPPEGSWEYMVTGGDNVAGCEAFDAATGTAWAPRANFPQNRAYMCTVILPDGKVFGVGGETDVGNPPPATAGAAPIDGAVYCDLDTAVLERAPLTPPGTPVKQSLMYDPATDVWARMATQTDPRGYHTTAVLLPDGRVLSAGGTGVNGSTDHLEIYSPPYLFNGPRPIITAAPTDLVHGQPFAIDTPKDVARVVLMAPCATTHTNDMSQRHVELAFTPTAGGVTAVAPPTPHVAPSGHYMLFILNNNGVPSVASWVHL